MNLASLIISCLSLITVVIIGWRSISLGERAARASEDSAQASQTAAKATEGSLIASRSAAAATERSVVAAERAAALAAQDARLRRLEAALEVILEMREVFNDQEMPHLHDGAPWTPARYSPEELQRFACSRQLEGRLVPFEDIFDARTSARTLTTTTNWSNGLLENAIAELKDAMRKS